MSEPTINVIDLMGEILVLPDGTSRTIIDHERAKRFIARAREQALEDAAMACEALAAFDEDNPGASAAEAVRALKVLA